MVCGLGLSLASLSQGVHAESDDKAHDFTFAYRTGPGSGPGPGPGAGFGSGSGIPFPIASGVFEMNISATCAYFPSPKPVEHTIIVTLLDTAADDIKASGQTRYKRKVTTKDNVVSIMTGPMVGYFRQDQTSFFVECRSEPNDTLAYQEILGFGRAKAVPANQSFEKLPIDQNPILVESPPRVLSH